MIKYKKDKGFTLIELLAVIVILAIIYLIAAPIVLNVINDASESSKIRSKELYLRAVDEAIVRKNLTSNFNPSKCTVNDNGDITCDGIELVIEVTGEKPCKGTITYENGKRISEDVAYCSGGNTSQEDNKNTSIANPPELMDSLTPVIYDEETGKWKVVDKTDSNWYNYDKQKWANAVIVKEESMKTVGTLLTVPEEENDFGSSDILAMFVWIPRYEYKIDTTDGQFGKGSTNKALPGEIEVNFISKNKDKATEGYIIHPGFTFGSDALSGIWVGKFETSHETLSTSEDSNNLGCSDESCTNADGIRILPNVTSLRSNRLSNFFFVSRSMSKDDNIFRIDKSKTDTHMMKNVEWGAVAYLSQSRYGKYGKDGEEVYINNCSKYITGIAGDSVSAEKSDICTNTYETGKGQKASTTGNITGVYDMSGGALESVMGYLITAYKDTWGSSNILGIEVNGANFTSEPEKKYFDEYDTIEPTNEDNKGHALGETEGWYGDNFIFVNKQQPWFFRGGVYSSSNPTGGTGIFAYDCSFGVNDSTSTFRVVVAPIQ